MGAKKYTKRRDARAKLKPIAFSSFSLMLLLKSLLKLPIKCHFMTDGTSHNAVVTLTKFLTGLSQSVHEERSDCICHYLYCTSRRSKESGKYRGKPGERGTSTPAFCVLTRTIFFLSPSPLKPPQRRPIDLNSLHVLFSQWRSCLFIDCARG